MKKLIYFLFSIFVLIGLPLQARAAAPTIVGPDDREEITGKAVGPEKAVVVIEIGNYGMCSGALVAPNIVLTAAHCLINNEGNYEEILNVYAVGMPKIEETNNIPEISNDTLKAGNVDRLIEAANKKAAALMLGKLSKYPYAKANRVWVSNQYMQDFREVKGKSVAEISSIVVEKIMTDVELTLKRDDYGIIVLDSDLCEEEDCSVGIKALTDEELENANIVAIGRGYDKPKRTLWKSPGKVGEVSKYIIEIDADILDGNSGGPVFKKDDPNNIIALIHSGLMMIEHANEGYPNGGLRIRQEMIDAVENAKSGKLEMYNLPNND